MHLHYTVQSMPIQPVANLNMLGIAVISSIMAFPLVMARKQIGRACSHSLPFSIISHVETSGRMRLGHLTLTQCHVCLGPVKSSNRHHVTMSKGMRRSITTSRANMLKYSHGKSRSNQYYNKQSSQGATQISI